MATIVTRLIKGGPLTNAEMDANLTNLNNDISSRVPNTLYVGSEILSRLLAVDGAGSGLDSNFLNGLINNTAIPSTPDKASIVARDINGDFAARIITANLVGSVTGNVVGNLTGSASHLGGQTASWYSDIPARLGYTPANNNSPSLSGVPLSPTPISSTNTDQIATTKFVQTIASAINNTIATEGMKINGFNAFSVTSSMGVNAIGSLNYWTSAGTGDLILPANPPYKSVVPITNLAAGSVVSVKPGAGATIYAALGTATTEIKLRYHESVVLSYDGANWVQLSYNMFGIGVNQTWQNVFSSRAFGANYTNSTGRPIQIYVVARTSTTALGYASLELNMNGLIFYGPTAYKPSASGTIVTGTTWTIPPGATYSVTGSVALHAWYELS